MQGQVFENVYLPGGGTCRCGTTLLPTTPVSYWKSSYGSAHDQVISCPTCVRPTKLVPERMWLMKRRLLLKNMRMGFLYGGTLTEAGEVYHPPIPPELAGEWSMVESELDSNWRKINVILMKLLEKLPRCEECSRYATYGIRHGPAYCDVHAEAHPTAQKLAWYEELDELGVAEDV
jgi:hypothetical protein